MKNNLFLSAALLGTLAMASCSKSSGPDSSSPNAARMTYELNATNTSTSMQKSTARGTLIWTSGYANPTLIQFSAKQQGTEIDYKSTNTSPIDIFSPSALDFGGFTLPAGTYKEIELKMRLNGQGSDPALDLMGNYTYNGVTTPIELQVQDEMWLKTETKDVTIDENTDMAALIDLNLADFLDGVSDNMIRNAQLTNGVLMISRTSNRSIYNAIVRNITDKRHHCEYRHRH